MQSLITRLFGNKKKIIYFVRHGESANNAKGLRQGHEGGLSNEGIKQATFLGERFKYSKIEAVFASPYERTQQTAYILNKQLKKPLFSLDLLAERKNPSDIIGKPADDLGVAHIVDIMDRSIHDDTFRYSDEENFIDLKVRARKLLEFIAARPEQNLLFVTHRIFLKFVVSYIQYGETMHSKEFAKLDFLNTVHPAGVTIVEYDPKKGNKENQGWKMLAWDDFGILHPEQEGA